MTDFIKDNVNVEVELDEYGHVPIAIQDQHTDIVDLQLCNKIADIELSTQPDIDQNVVSLVAGHGVVAGNVICFKSGIHFYQGIAIAVSTNDITLDSPLDFSFPVGSEAFRSVSNMAVNGSVTPVIFKVSPPASTKWDLCRVIITMTDDLAMDDGKFGGISAISKGVVIRKKNASYKNIFNAKTNGDFRSRSFDVQYLDATLGPGGLYGFGCRRSFNGFDKNGVVIRLDGDTADEFQFIIQDDLTGLSSLRACIQGHVVSGES